MFFVKSQINRFHSVIYANESSNESKNWKKKKKTLRMIHNLQLFWYLDIGNAVLCVNINKKIKILTGIHMWFQVSSNFSPLREIYIVLQYKPVYNTTTTSMPAKTGAIMSQLYDQATKGWARFWPTFIHNITNCTNNLYPNTNTTNTRCRSFPPVSHPISLPWQTRNPGKMPFSISPTRRCKFYCPKMPVVKRFGHSLT